jgi:hypothetical protein
MSAHNGLAFEVHALQRELRSLELGQHSEVPDAVLALVRAARRISHLAHEVAADGMGAARDEVSLVRVTDACLVAEGGRVEPGDLEAALALIAKRLSRSQTDAAGDEMSRVQRTLSAIANLPGVSAE